MNMVISRLLSVSLLLLVIFSVMPAAVLAEAVNLNAEQLSSISNRCTSAQISLEQLQKRDAVSRINRGRTYDQLMTQITALNSRFAFNKISPPPELLTITTEMQVHIDRFRSVSDKEYLEHIINATKIDCKNKPAEFYALIVSARGDRDRVVAEISKLQALIGQYREKLTAYQSSLSEANREN